VAIKVDGPGAIRASNARRTGKAEKSGSGFASHLGGDDAAVANAGGSQFLTRIDGLVALQEAPDPAQGRRRAAQRGNDLLDQLNEIRHGLLIGAVPLDKLKALARKLAEAQFRVSDPQLAEIIQDIELRCAVELAKLGIDPDSI
jgi:Class II flagellar assembly regulator